MKTIVAGYDGTEHGERALARAAELARALGAKLIVVSVGRSTRVTAPELVLEPVVPGGPMAPGAAGGPAALPVPAPPEPQEPDETVHALERARSFLAPRDVDADFVSEVGDPADRLLSIAEDRDADLIVVGSRERGFLERLLGEGTDEKVARRADRDVLLVQEPRLLSALVRAHQLGDGELVLAEQSLELVLSHTGRQIRVRVESAQAEEVPVSSMTGRRARTAVAGRAKVVAALRRGPLSFRELRRVRRDTPGDPVGERPARRVRIVDDEGERLVSLGAFTHSSGGETSSPSHVNLRGISPPASNAELVSEKPSAMGTACHAGAPLNARGGSRSVSPEALPEERPPALRRELPAIRAIAKAEFADHPSLGRNELVHLVESLWGRPVHECRMAAVELLQLGSALLRAADLTLVERLIRESRASDTGEVG